MTGFSFFLHKTIFDYYYEPENENKNKNILLNKWSIKIDRKKLSVVSTNYSNESIINDLLILKTQSYNWSRYPVKKRKIIVAVITDKK